MKKKKKHAEKARRTAEKDLFDEQVRYTCGPKILFLFAVIENQLRENDLDETQLTSVLSNVLDRQCQHFILLISRWIWEKEGPVGVFICSPISLPCCCSVRAWDNLTLPPSWSPAGLLDDACVETWECPCRSDDGLLRLKDWKEFWFCQFVGFVFICLICRIVWLMTNGMKGEREREREFDIHLRYGWLLDQKWEEEETTPWTKCLLHQMYLFCNEKGKRKSFSPVVFFSKQSNENRKWSPALYREKGECRVVL